MLWKWTWPCPFNVSVSAGHVTHGWRPHPGNSQLQHRGFCWPRHVPPLLWVTPPSHPTLRTGLMSRRCLMFLYCCILMCSTVNVCVSFHTHFTYQACSLCLWPYTYLISAGRWLAHAFLHHSLCAEELLRSRGRNITYSCTRQTSLLLFYFLFFRFDKVWSFFVCFWCFERFLEELRS